MDLWDGNSGVNGLSEEVLEEVGVGSSQYASIVGVEFVVDDLLVVEASYIDGRGKADVNRGVDGGEHGI